MMYLFVKEDPIEDRSLRSNVKRPLIQLLSPAVRYTRVMAGDDSSMVNLKYPARWVNAKGSKGLFVDAIIGQQFWGKLLVTAICSLGMKNRSLLVASSVVPHPNTWLAG